MTRQAVCSFVFASCLGFAWVTLAPADVTTSGSIYNAYGQYRVGYTADGTLLIDAGSELSDTQGNVGYNSGCSGTATVTGSGSSWANSSDLMVGRSGDGTLNIRAGGQVNNFFGYIGYSSGCAGTATVNGDGSTWTNNGKLYVGYSGNGTLNVEAGAQVDNGACLVGTFSGSVSSATVTGTGSRLTNTFDLYLGSSGSGALSIEAGGQITNGYGYLGCNPGGSGTATVTGAGSTWTNTGGLTVGCTGTGTLNIQDGGQVTSSTASLGYDSRAVGTATVSGTGSTWVNSSSLYVGKGGSGTLSIQGGGQVSSAGAFLAYTYSSTGSATVTGTGSTWCITDEIRLGNGPFSTGTLNIEAGGQVSNNAGRLAVGSQATAAVSVSGVGSTWINRSDLYVGDAVASGVPGNATLTVTDGGLVTAQTLFASPNDLHGNGTIIVHGVVLDSDLRFDSTHPLVQTLGFGSGGTISLNLDASGGLGVGCKGTGTLRIADGVTVIGTSGCLGRWSGSTGIATVTGAGSTWNTTGELDVGYRGTGTLIIEAGGQVSDADAYLGYRSTGTATVIGASSRWTNTAGVTVGYDGTGTLTIEAGGQMTNSNATLAADSPFSTGTVTVRGRGSTWTCSGGLSVGDAGRGILNIQAGGRVSNTYGYFGAYHGSGTATVTGPGSAWTNSNILYVGFFGSIGSLTAADGGEVTASSLTIDNSKCAVRLHVSGNDMLVLGDTTTTGSITNKGTISLYADTFLPAGTYTPISEYAGRTMTWSGTGTCNAFGGTWDNAAKTFTVPTASALTAGSSGSITSAQRLLFTDRASGQRVGASFGTVTTGTAFLAALTTDAELNALAATPGFSGSVLSARDFTTDVTGSQVLLSYDLGPGLQDFTLWHLQGTTWTQYAPDLLTYDSNGILSFTVSDFSGYAVASVPEPSAIALLGAGAIALLACGWRWRKLAGPAAGWHCGRVPPRREPNGSRAPRV